MRRRGCCSAAIAAVAGVLFAINFKLAPDLWFQGLKSFPAVILAYGLFGSADIERV